MEFKLDQSVVFVEDSGETFVTNVAYDNGDDIVQIYGRAGVFNALRTRVFAVRDDEGVKTCLLELRDKFTKRIANIDQEIYQIDERLTD